ncbi:hypothetical protein L7F22_035440 [Adiantum nelumboides]|nr:hypothetical protein [Adiantum nelumboides]
MVSQVPSVQHDWPEPGYGADYRGTSRGIGASDYNNTHWLWQELFQQQPMSSPRSSACGLGDVEAYLSKVHAVRPPHLGKQKIVRWFYPPEVDYRLSLLLEDSKGLVVWIIEAKVLSKPEMQYLALIPLFTQCNLKTMVEEDETHS